MYHAMTGVEKGDSQVAYGALELRASGIEAAVRELWARELRAGPLDWEQSGLRPHAVNCGQRSRAQVRWIGSNRD